MYSVSLPNKLNVSFSYPTFLMIYMLGYFPYLPKLYFHMLRQRAKVLGGPAAVSQKKDS
jgi:hypothetical protein